MPGLYDILIRYLKEKGIAVPDKLIPPEYKK